MPNRPQRPQAGASSGGRSGVNLGFLIDPTGGGLAGGEVNPGQLAGEESAMPTYNSVGPENETLPGYGNTNTQQMAVAPTQNPYTVKNKFGDFLSGYKASAAAQAANMGIQSEQFVNQLALHNFYQEQAQRLKDTLATGLANTRNAQAIQYGYDPEDAPQFRKLINQNADLALTAKYDELASAAPYVGETSSYNARQKLLQARGGMENQPAVNAATRSGIDATHDENLLRGLRDSQQYSFLSSNPSFTAQSMKAGLDTQLGGVRRANSEQIRPGEGVMNFDPQSGMFTGGQQMGYPQESFGTAKINGQDVPVKQMIPGRISPILAPIPAGGKANFNAPTPGTNNVINDNVQVTQPSAAPLFNSNYMTPPTGAIPVVGQMLKSGAQAFGSNTLNATKQAFDATQIPALLQWLQQNGLNKKTLWQGGQ